MKRVLFYILILCYSTIYAQTIEDAKKLYENKQYKNAIEIFQKFPKNSESHYYLAKAYLTGNGIEKDVSKAIEYAKKSVNQNNSSGLNLLGTMYQYGDGVEIDGLQALMYYKLASNLGNTKSMSNIGDMYKQGKVVKQDFKIAEKWFNKAIAQNPSDSHAYANLGDLYRFNYKKFNKAIEYYQKAIDTGISKSEGYYHIATIYDYNLKDHEKALEYYQKALERGNNKANLNIGWIYNFQFKNKEKALEYFNEVLKIYLNNNNDKKYFKENDIATIYKIKYEYEQAEHYYQKSISNGNNYTYRLLGDLYFYTYRQNEKALEYYKRFLNYYKDDKYAIERISQIYLDKENSELSKIWFKKLYQITQDSRYLDIVDDYLLLKKLNTKNIINKQSGNIIPIIDSLKYKNSIIYDCADNYKLIGCRTTDHKSIQIYNSEKFDKIKDVRIDPNFNIVKFIIGYNDILYIYAKSNNKSIILLYDINLDKISKSLHLKEFDSDDVKLAISSDGKYLVLANFVEYRIVDLDTEKNILIKPRSDFSLLYKSFNIEKIDNDYLLLVNEQKLKNVTVYSVRKKIKLKSYNYANRLQVIKKNIYHINKSSIEIKDYFNNFIETIILNDSKVLNDSSYISLDEKFITSSLKGKVYIYNLNKKKIEKEFNTTLKYPTFFKNYLLGIKNGNYYSYHFKTHKEYSLFSEKDLINIKNINTNNQNLTLYLQNNCLKFDFTDFVVSKQKQECNTHNSINNYNLDYDDKHVIILDKKTHAVKSKIFNMFGGKYKILNKLIDDKFVLINKSLYDLEGKKVGILPSSLYFVNYDFITSNANNIFVKYDDSDIIRIFSLNDSSSKKNEKIKNIFEKYNVSYAQTFKYNIFSDILSKFFFSYNNPKELSNIASIYIKNEKDWIIYTPEGLFTYGGNGKDLLKYHQNQGYDKEAKIIENEKLFDKFYRPDLIKKILAGEKVDIPLDVKAVILNIKPPELKILENKMLNEKDIDLTYQICDAGNGISDPKLIINGQAINPPTSRGFSISKIDSKDGKCKIYNSIHTLMPGNNTIKLKAYDEEKNIANISEKLEITTSYKINEKPNLYFLSIAVSDYEDDNLDLKYPVKDVETVKEKIQQQGKTIYGNIVTYDLYDNKVTKEKIEKTFDDISSKIKINDAFVLYIAGHGISKDGLYQFISHKSNERISINNLKQNLSKIPTSKSLVLLDTCQSGAAIESIDTKATKNRLAYDSKVNYIVASSSNQVALEGYNEHGVFTYSVLDAIAKNDKLKVWGLADHISEIVPKITQEKFQYSQVPQAKLNSNFQIIGN